MCPKCGFSSVEEESELLNENKLPSTRQGNPGSSLKILDGEKGPDTLPTISIDCPRCGNNIAFWWMLQTRSADEATTQFYRCTKCDHTWRNYS